MRSDRTTVSHYCYFFVSHSGAPYAIVEYTLNSVRLNPALVYRIENLSFCLETYRENNATANDNQPRFLELYLFTLPDDPFDNLFGDFVSFPGLTQANISRGAFSYSGLTGNFGAKWHPMTVVPTVANGFYDAGNHNPNFFARFASSGGATEADYSSTIAPMAVAARGTQVILQAGVGFEYAVRPLPQTPEFNPKDGNFLVAAIEMHPNRGNATAFGGVAFDWVRIGGRLNFDLVGLEPREVAR